MPTLLRRKRRTICSRWLRALTVNSRSVRPGPAGPGSAGTGCVDAACVVVMGTSLAAGSTQPDPRVEHGVEQVGDQVEQDDEERAHHQPAEDDVDVVVADAVLQQVSTHPVPADHLFGNYRAAEQG